MKTALNKVRRFFCVASFYVVLLPIFYILKPFWCIRIGMGMSRIGHLAGNTDLFLRKRQIQKSKKVCITIMSVLNPSNKFLVGMFSRHLFVTDKKIFFYYVTQIYDLLKKYGYLEPFAHNSVEYKISSTTKSILRFTAEEERLGYENLRSMGLSEDDWFICIHARDPSYIKSLDTHRNLEKYEEVYGHRDCGIESYFLAAERIAEMGGWVIRMGSEVDGPLPDNLHPKIIDYATKFRSEFMDVFICAKCRFFLGNTSGLVMVPPLFDRPVAVANQVPICAPSMQSRDYFIPKIPVDVVTRQPITFAEAYRRGLFGTHEQPVDSPAAFRRAFGRDLTGDFYAKANVLMPDNDPEDVWDLACDMLDRERMIAPPPRRCACRRCSWSASWVTFLNGNMPDLLGHASL